MKKFFTKKRLIIGGIALICLLCLIFFLNKPKKDKGPHYQVVTVAKTADLTLTGSVIPNQSQVLDLPNGKVQNIAVVNGQKVQRGETLVTAYDETAAQEVASLQADISKQQRSQNSQQRTIANLQRQMRGLSQSDDGYSELQSQLTEAQNQVADAQADLNQDNTKLATAQAKVNPTLTAPFDGIIAVDDSKQNHPVLTLYSAGLQFKGYISEYDYNKVKVDTPVTVTATATNHHQDTKVSFLATFPAREDGKSNGSKYEIHADLSPESFMNGQTVKLAAKQSEVQIAAKAVKKHHVFVYQHGKVRAIRVDGQIKGAVFVVTDGLKAGQKIIANPDTKLKDGDSIDSND
ncbi:efflux RND transporter periplasmic adaptor subunit [Ligilactobacillus equi]|uniref:RND family efflux transporter MFP subunit n=1 Tax=Ligilactobacillus equi DSM 15833 = JCM 10991 TaxID=1423740 RepID=A0A0R1TNF2_9LACO|nr:hypothetical protein [Ligilactobacillus equi]KRL82993.1 RND family efflux transporter MFP subunit [Ligilactobacillus equi DSM 15833 = JCM 10991]